MTADELTRTGVLRIRRTWRDRWRNALKPRPAATPEPEMDRIQLAAPESPQEATVDGHIYVSNEPEPGEHTTALGRHRVARAVEQPPAPRDLSLEQATRRIPVLERTLANLGLEPEEAVIFHRLSGSWHSGATDDGPAFDHSGDAIRLPVIDQEGGESRD